MNLQEPIVIPSPEGGSGHRVLGVLLAAGVVFAGLYAVGVVPRLVLHRNLQADAAAARQRLPLVSTTSPRRAPEAIEVQLPGSMQAFLETGIYARTDGYLKARYVDIGDHVTKGQLLADIDTPEIDQQLNQAQATLSQSKADVVRLEANLALARTTLRRFVTIGVGAVTQQEIDERADTATTSLKAVDAARETVNANQANVRRLLELQGFQKVYAPFDGIITARNVDPGALISAGSNSGVTQLFSLAQVDVLRIFVYVPQSYAPDITVGQAADVTVRELPGRVFQGKVTRTAGAIDPSSRTMLTEVQVPNPEGLLLSGSYATVRFRVQRADPPLVIPSGALLVGAAGVRVAAVDGDATLHYRPIQIGRDDGQEVEVLSGIDTNDVLATGLAAGIADGSRVEVARNPAPR
jgi:RND family efflux transporter MFP subunit